MLFALHLSFPLFLSRVPETSFHVPCNFHQGSRLRQLFFGNLQGRKLGGDIGKLMGNCGDIGGKLGESWGEIRGKLGGKELLLQARLNSSAFPLQVTQRRWSRKSKNTVLFNGFRKGKHNTPCFEPAERQPGTPVSPDPQRLLLSDCHQIAARYVGVLGGGTIYRLLGIRHAEQCRRI